VTLVNILVKVFHNRDGAADLNIDVALIPHGQVGVVRDDPTVVKPLLMPEEAIYKEELYFQMC
jgi:hypothetical protein